MEQRILSINPGSSSRKYAVYNQSELVANSHYESAQDGTFRFHCAAMDRDVEREIQADEFKNSLGHFLTFLQNEFNLNSQIFDGVGLRLVTPGRQFMQHQPFSSELAEHLQSHLEMAPLHIAATLDQYKKVRSALPDTPVFAISDSAFHSTLRHEARNYAIDSELADQQGIYRYGYHGISCQSVMRQLGDSPFSHHQRVLIAHLGSGASITAVVDGQSIDTSMGYSPLEGLVMASRSGDIDPAAALLLKQAAGLVSDRQLEDYLNEEAGLKGVSGASEDIRDLLQLEAQGHQRASLALNMMVYRIVKYIGAYTAAMGGLDALIFTATVGVRSVPIRQRIVADLGGLGLILKEAKNQGYQGGLDSISSADSEADIVVVPTNEEAEIAQQTSSLISST